MKSIWALIISASLMVACDEDDPSPQGIFDFGTEFQLQFDATVFSADSVLSVSFKEIIEDSRCPGDATCVWAGIGVISLEVKENGQSHTVQLGTYDHQTHQNDTIISGYYYQLIKLDPYPESTAQISAKDYIATLLIERR